MEQEIDHNTQLKTLEGEHIKADEHLNELDQEIEEEKHRIYDIEHNTKITDADRNKQLITEKRKLKQAEEKKKQEIKKQLRNEKKRALITFSLTVNVNLDKFDDLTMRNFIDQDQITYLLDIEEY